MVYLSSTKTYNPRISIFYKMERFNMNADYVDIVENLVFKHSLICMTLN
ncbi:MAG: hypothetical protein IJJ11_08365 [Methanosphaera sp.]|nr:hypothetical protein [Methanosphaera sp.]